MFLFLPSVALLPPNEFVFIAKHLTPENKENDNMYINVLSLAFSYVILEYSKHIKVILDMFLLRYSTCQQNSKVIYGTCP